MCQIGAQNISRSQVIADIDTLFNTLTEVHPNLYDRISMSDLNEKITNLKAGLQDSISTIELYSRVAPIVALLGDAHTTVALPYREVMIKAGRYVPVYPTIDSNTGRMYVKASVENVVRHTRSASLTISLWR